MIYLASPYTHPELAVRMERNAAACRAAAYLMEQRGLVVYSPIAHSHPIEQHMSERRDHDWWMRQCTGILHRCDALYVLRIEGWEASKGVAQEIRLAIQLGLPIFACDASGTVVEEFQ